jgi:GT2 family glycosyltransferase
VGEFGRDIAILRDSLMRQALDDGYSHLLMMDTDQAYPRDVITKLWAHAKAGREVVIAPVHRRYPPYELILFRGAPDAYTAVPDAEKYSGDLIPVDAGGSGCMIISLRAALELDDPWFELGFTPSGRPLGEDIGFCARMREAGYHIWADTSIEIDHLARITINREFHEVHTRLNRAAAPVKSP